MTTIQKQNDTIKRFCAFFPEKDEVQTSKIGSTIKNQLPLIKEAVGAGIFIAFFNAEQADLHFEAFLVKFPQLAKMKSMGAGWYFWSYSQEATLKAKTMLVASLAKWDAKQKAFQERKKRQEETVPVMVDIDSMSQFPSLGQQESKREEKGVWVRAPTIVTMVEPTAPPMEADRFTTLTAPDVSAWGEAQ